jgi:hypothetical protein
MLVCFITSGFCYSMLDQDVALECGDQLLHPLPGKPTEVGTIYFTLPLGVRLEAFSLESRRHHPRSICGVFRYARFLGSLVRLRGIKVCAEPTVSKEHVC